MEIKYDLSLLLFFKYLKFRLKYHQVPIGSLSEQKLGSCTKDNLEKVTNPRKMLGKPYTQCGRSI